MISRENLMPFFPEASLDKVLEIFESFDLHLSIVRPRNTKTGDYRRQNRRPVHRIRINSNLPPYQFLITFIHEVAHMMVVEKYKKRVLPHGNEWQQCFRSLGEKFINSQCFPEDIMQAFQFHLFKGYASTFTDANLMKALAVYSPENQLPLLESLEKDSVFQLKQRLFKKGEKRRTRYLCTCISNGKPYLVSARATVIPFNENIGN